MNNTNTNEQNTIKILVILFCLFFSLDIIHINDISLHICAILLCTIINSLLIYNLLLKHIIGYFLPSYIAHRFFGCHVGFWKFLKGDTHKVQYGYYDNIDINKYNKENIPLDQRDHIIMYTHQCEECGRLWDEAHGGINS